MEKQKFILAVSGGVDSVVLLHKLAVKKSPNITYIVAHFDHGIRKDSADDAAFVARLATSYGYKFELGTGGLGQNASEALAREKRYEFLRFMKEKHQAEKIITAHHEDDVLETMVLNLIRGTGPRGLMPMSKPSDILRPLLNTSKLDLLHYAEKHGIAWREDSTNEDESYLRNYIRKRLMSELEPHRKMLLEVRRKLVDIYFEADMLLHLATPQKNVISRSYFLTFPFSVQREIVRMWLATFGVTEVDRQLLERVAIAIKTLPRGRKADINVEYWLSSQPHNVQIIKKV
jgi:tRNA(Ile)-lysidine synthase